MYKSIGSSYYKLKHLPKINESYLIYGPLWILQLWLNATFEPKLHITKSKALLEETDCRSIEGTRFALVTPYDSPSQITFMKYINLFLESKTFLSTMAHFVDICVELTWFRNRFPSVTSEATAMSNFV